MTTFTTIIPTRVYRFCSGKHSFQALLLFSVLLLAACGGTPHGLRRKQVRPLLELAAKQMHVPYVWGGSSPKGFDCSGFTWYCYQQFGVQLPRTALEQSRAGNKVRGRRAKPGDLIFFKGPDHKVKKPGHVGIVVAGRKQSIQFIHAGSRGITLSTLSEPYFKKRYRGIRRFRR